MGTKERFCVFVLPFRNAREVLFFLVFGEREEFERGKSSSVFSFFLFSPWLVLFSFLFRLLLEPLAWALERKRERAGIKAATTIFSLN